MKRSVIDMWKIFSEPLEGRVSSMYVDVKGLVTTGVGNLIDPVQLALQLPWRTDFGAGPPASPAEIQAAWNGLKSQADKYKKLHWKYAAKLNDLRLTDEDMDKLIDQKRSEFESHLKKYHFPDWDTFPADGQLGIMSMSWACGPGFPSTFKNFKAAVLAQNWEAARASCKIRETNNPGVVPRNVANRTCFSNAAIVVQNGLDRDKLYWPGVPTLETVPPPDGQAGEKPAMPALSVDESTWIGEPQLGLPDDVYNELQEMKSDDD